MASGPASADRPATDSATVLPKKQQKGGASATAAPGHGADKSRGGKNSKVAQDPAAPAPASQNITATNVESDSKYEDVPHLERVKGDVDVPDHLKTETPNASVTLQRRINPYYLDGMDRPHIPRALVAVDKDHPYGTVGYNHGNLTVMQQHVAFFDRNGDGVIYPWETYSGFRAIGYNILVSMWAASIIHMFMSYKTLDSWIPSPLFPIYIKNINRCKHASDSDVYDEEGRFLPSKFEEIFEKFARTRRDGLTFGELLDMTDAFSNTFDALGWVAAKLEWGFTYWSVKDEDGFAPKEGIRGVFDGSIFYYLESRYQGKSKYA